MKFCVDCKWYVHEEMKEFRGLVIMPIEHQCAHINALHMVTKKPGSAEEMRNLGCFCGANAKWFEENEKGKVLVVESVEKIV